MKCNPEFTQYMPKKAMKGISCHASLIHFSKVRVGSENLNIPGAYSSSGRVFKSSG